MSDRFVGAALTLAFLLLTGIVVAVGYSGLGAMDRLNADAQQIASTQWEDVQLADEALRYSNQNSRITMQIVITGDRQEVDSLLANRIENNARISDLIKQLQNRVGSKEEQTLLNAVIDTRNCYLESSQHAIDIFLEQENADKARQSLIQVTTPLLAKYHAAWSDFTRFQTIEMNQQLQKSATRYAADRLRAIYLLILAVSLALGVALLAVPKILIGIRSRTIAEHKLRELNSELEVGVLERTAELDKAYKNLLAEIEERRRVEERLVAKTVFLEAQANSTIDGILVVDSDNKKILQNQRFVDLFQLPQSIVENDDDNAALEFVVSKVAQPEPFLQKVRYLYEHAEDTSRDEIALKDGTMLDRYSSPVLGPNGKHYGRIWTFRDITDRKAAEERVQFLAYYDALTKLPNRALLQDRLENALANARRRKDRVALLFLDLDRFKIINDSLGHSVGDLLLQEVAERLKKEARELDTVARLGGDEFLVVLAGVKEPGDAAIVAARIVERMTAGFSIQGHDLRVTCSLGISVFPENGTDSETLVKNADAAMYSAKENGRNTFRFFTEDMHVQAVERLTLSNSLRQALDNQELFLEYQPQMDIATGRVTGLEALLRWQHPEVGLVPPDRFIRIAENSGLIMSIGEWVLRTACLQCRQWQDEGLPAVPVAVNVSAIQFRQEGFCELIRRILQETGLAPQYLELELTESLLLSNADVTSAVLANLKDMGLKLAIDDFGTGYSSLSYLKTFPVSRLKIDRSFIRDVAVNPDDAAITTAIISMAKSLNLKVIAEGVENEPQMAFLRTHHCDEIQGYYFSKPVSADEVVEKFAIYGESPLVHRR